MLLSESNSKHAYLIKPILLATLVAGTLDMLGAILVYHVIMQIVTVMQILQGIASTVFGKTAFSNPMVMALIGLIVHYVIAFCFAVAYLLVFPYIKFLKKNTLLSGLLYGVVVWFIMNLIIVPLANGHNYTFLWPAFLRQVITLMICIGLPISIIISNYYSKKQSLL